MTGHRARPHQAISPTEAYGSEPTLEIIDFGICLLRGVVAERRARAGAGDDWPELLTYIEGGNALIGQGLAPEYHLSPADRVTLTRLVTAHHEEMKGAEAPDRMELMALRGFLETIADDRHVVAISGRELRDLLAEIVARHPDEIPKPLRSLNGESDPDGVAPGDQLADRVRALAGREPSQALAPLNDRVEVPAPTEPRELPRPRRRSKNQSTRSGRA